MTQCIVRLFIRVEDSNFLHRAIGAFSLSVAENIPQVAGTSSSVGNDYINGY